MLYKSVLLTMLLLPVIGCVNVERERPKMDCLLEPPVLDERTMTDEDVLKWDFYNRRWDALCRVSVKVPFPA